MCTDVTPSNRREDGRGKGEKPMTKMQTIANQPLRSEDEPEHGNQG